MLTKEGRWYVGGSLVIVALVLVLWLWSYLVWIGLALALLVVGWIAWRVWGVIHQGLTAIRLRNAQVAAGQAEAEALLAQAEQARAVADLRHAEAEAARRRVHLIPEGYIGAQLHHPFEAGLYHVWSFTQEVTAPPPASVPALPAPVEPARILQPVPSARMLILQGALGRSEELLLGFDAEGHDIRRTWKQVKAVLILGLQGGGKTTTACWLLCQVVLSGGRLAVIDKHAHSAEDSLSVKLTPLQGCFACPVGHDSETALAAVQFVRRVFLARLDGAVCDYPLLLVVDEFSAIMRQSGTDGPWATVAETLIPLLEDLNFEGRKHQCYAICIGQAANASRSGGSEVRDTFNTRIVHAMREKQAQMLSLTEQKQQIVRLAAGQVYIDMEGPEEPFFAQVPYVTDADVQLVAAQVQGPILPPLPMKPTVVEAAPEPVCVEATPPPMPETAPVASTHTLTHKAMRVTPEQRQFILEQKAQGKSDSAVAVLLWNDAHKNVLVRQVWEAHQAQAQAQAKPSDEA